MTALSRRRFLLRSAAGAAGLGAVALLAACGAGGSASAGSSAGSIAASGNVSSSAAPTTASSSAAAATSSAATSSSAAASAATTASSAASSAASTPVAAASSAPATGPVTLNFYSNGDTNIHDLWNTDLLPVWDQANPTMKIKLIFSEHGTDNSATIDKLAGAKAAGKPTDIDLYEDDTDLQTYGQQGIFTKLDTGKVPDLAKCNQAVVQQRSGFGVPYRASSVVLAYNSQFVADPPKTLDTLYDWVKANKGKFTYNPPDKGGSGSAFVTATLKKFIPQDQLAAFQSDAKYDPKLESSWNQGFDLLKSLGPFVENNGFYPGGNVPVLQELGKQTIYVAPVWSDQGLSYLSQKLLPDSVKLEQIDPPFTGGASYLGVPSGSQHQDQAYQFLNWVLQPAQQSVIINKINGYPGIEWQYMPPDVQQKFSQLAKSYDTFSFSSKFSADVNKLWYEKVAGTPPPPSK